LSRSKDSWTSPCGAALVLLVWSWTEDKGWSLSLAVGQVDPVFPQAWERGKTRKD
jgi:hypothetical protein